MRMLRRWMIPVLLVVSTVFIAPSGANAEKKERYIELEALIVEGQIQRPQAVYIIRRAGLDFGVGAKRNSFIDKVKETIQEEPF